MSIDTLEMLSSIFYIASVVFLLIAVALFFLFKIPSTIGFLTGSNRQKSIAQLRKESEETLDGTSQSISKNLRTGSLAKTEKILTDPRQKNNGNENKTVFEEKTELLDNNATSVLVPETAVLNSISASDTSVNEAVMTDVIEILADITFIHTNEIVE